MKEEKEGEEGSKWGERDVAKNGENLKYSLSTPRTFHVCFCKMTYRYREICVVILTGAIFSTVMANEIH
jgi:hypothetical protein